MTGGSTFTLIGDLAMVCQLSVYNLYASYNSVMFVGCHRLMFVDVTGVHNLSFHF